MAVDKVALEGGSDRIAALKEAMSKPPTNDPTEEEMLAAEQELKDEVNEDDRKAAAESSEEVGGLPISPEMMRDRRLAGKPYHKSDEVEHDGLIHETGPKLDTHVMIPPEVFEKREEYPFLPSAPTKEEIVKGSTITVTRTWKEGGMVKAEEMEDNLIDVHRFQTQPADVSYEVGMTINMDNMEFVKITVGARVPCYIEEMNEGFRSAKKFVDLRLAAETTSVKEHRKKRREKGRTE